MDSSEHLHLTPPHQLHPEVDDPLVVHQQIVSDVRNAACQGQHMLLKIVGWRRLENQADSGSLSTGNCVTGQQQTDRRAQAGPIGSRTTTGICREPARFWYSS